MNKLKDTLALCDECYRHVPAITFERNGQIWIQKSCEHHGIIENLVDPDADFYLNNNYKKTPALSYFIEITTRCNLACPHCYQEPDNLSTDPSLELLLGKIGLFPDDGYGIALVGAEPTTRNDLPEIIQGIRDMPRLYRNIMVLSNCVNLSKKSYAEKFKDIENLTWTIGLNHPDYQGAKIRSKQIQGIQNCNELGLVIKNINYTLEGLHQLEYCLQEMQEFGGGICSEYKVTCGSEIGRYPDDTQVYLSDLVREVKHLAKKHQWTFEIDDSGRGNRSHYRVLINGINVCLIHYPDVKILDLAEVYAETIGAVVPGKPFSPLNHQIILRDRAINKKLPLFDTIPSDWIDPSVK